MRPISIKFEMIHPSARVPTRGTELSAYYDLYSCETVTIEDGETYLCHTGLKLQCSRDYFIDIRARSSLGKDGVSISNSPGTVDPDYAGEILVELYNHSGKPYSIEVGHRIAQFNIFPRNELRFVESAVKGFHKGFGSTGR